MDCVAENLRLCMLDAGDEAEFRAMRREFELSGGRIHPGFIRACGGDFQALLTLLQSRARGEGLPEGHVPSSDYALKDSAGRIYGACSIRHWLSAELLRSGGHIGYGIRPSERGRGYGTLQLRLALERAREMGLGRVLVTCDRENPASARVILKNGGALENEITLPNGTAFQRYWISL